MSWNKKLWVPVGTSGIAGIETLFCCLCWRPWAVALAVRPRPSLCSRLRRDCRPVLQAGLRGGDSDEGFCPTALLWSAQTLGFAGLLAISGLPERLLPPSGGAAWEPSGVYYPGQEVKMAPEALMLWGWVTLGGSPG